MKQLSNRQILLALVASPPTKAPTSAPPQDHGADVRVVMTAAAMEFITPLTLQALSGNPVHTALLDPEAEAGMGRELALGGRSRRTGQRRLYGAPGKRPRRRLTDHLCLATPAPIALAPAMNQGMWRDPQPRRRRHAGQRGVAVRPAAENKPAAILAPAACSKPSNWRTGNRVI